VPVITRILELPGKTTESENNFAILIKVILLFDVLCIIYFGVEYTNIVSLPIAGAS